MNGIDHERMMREQSHRQFEYMAQSFFKRWQPKEPDEAAMFSGELFALVRQIYMDASGPANDQIRSVMQIVGACTSDPFGRGKS